MAMPKTRTRTRPGRRIRPATWATTMPPARSAPVARMSSPSSTGGEPPLAVGLERGQEAVHGAGDVAERRERGLDVALALQGVVEALELEPLERRAAGDGPRHPGRIGGPADEQRGRRCGR